MLPKNNTYMENRQEKCLAYQDEQGLIRNIHHFDNNLAQNFFGYYRLLI